MKVLTVVVTHNRLELLKQCIDRWEKQTADSDLLIVDNMSTDGTREFIASLTDPRVYRLLLPKNAGGAGGFNRGLRWCAEHGYDAAWVMDDDTLPRPGALERLLEAGQALKGRYGFLASYVLWTDGTPCRMNLLKPAPGAPEPLSGVMEVPQATFVSCLFPTSIIRQFGLPISDFFIWGDDIEYTRRIAVRGGIPGYWVRNSVTIHEMEANEGNAIERDDFERLDRYRYAYRNEHYLYRQEGPPGFLHYTGRCGLHALRVLFLAKDHRFTRLRVIFRQYFAGFRFNPSIEFPDAVQQPSETV